MKEKFEYPETSKYIVAIALADMQGFRDKIEQKFGQKDCELFANWMLGWLDDATDADERIVEEYVYRVIGEKINELKGVENE